MFMRISLPIRKGIVNLFTALGLDIAYTFGVKAPLTVGGFWCLPQLVFSALNYPQTFFIFELLVVARSPSASHSPARVGRVVLTGADAEVEAERCRRHR